MTQPVWMPASQEKLTVIEDKQQWQILLNECRRTETPITDLHVRALAIEEEDWSDLEWIRVWFDHCRFPGLSVCRGRFRDVWWDNSDISGGDIRRSRLSSCRWDQGKSVGLTVSNSFLRKTTFEHWQGRYVQWHSCQMEQIAFINSVCTEALFSDCPFKDVRFSQTDLQRAQFFKTYLKGMDLTSCQIDGLSVSDRMTELKGAVVDMVQAADIARMLGVIIR